MLIPARRWLALALGSLLGILFDQWIRVPWLGAGAGLFVLLLVVGLLIVAVLCPRPLQRRNFLLGLTLLLVAAVPGLRDSPVLVAVTTVGLFPLLLLAAGVVTGPPIDALTPGDYLRTLAVVAGCMLTRAASPVAALSAAVIRRVPARGRAAP